MDFFSISIAMCILSFFMFLWICFFFIRNFEIYERNLLLLKSSLFMFVSFSSFHFEFKLSVSQSDYTFIFSFISFACLMYAIFTIAVLVSKVYGEKIKYRNMYRNLYSIMSGIIYSINTIYGTYLTSFILLSFMMIFPGVILAKGLISSKQNLYRTPFVYQIAILTVFYILKMVNLFTNAGISPTNPNDLDSLYTMLILITLSMFYITYLLEYNFLLSKRLESKSINLSQTLSQVIIDSEKDELTKIPNRSKINSMLETCMKSFTEYGIDFMIAMIDVNNFKQVNDLHGHIYGDETLVKISKSLICSTRNQDVVGRWGGDEFLIIFPNTKFDFSNETRYKIMNCVESEEISLSIGFSTASECGDIKSMLLMADSRMYVCKNEIRKTNLNNSKVHL